MPDWDLYGEFWATANPDRTSASPFLYNFYPHGQRPSDFMQSSFKINQPARDIYRNEPKSLFMNTFELVQESRGQRLLNESITGDYSTKLQPLPVTDWLKAIPGGAAQMVGLSSPPALTDYVLNEKEGEYWNGPNDFFINLSLKREQGSIPLPPVSTMGGREAFTPHTYKATRPAYNDKTDRWEPVEMDVEGLSFTPQNIPAADLEDFMESVKTAREAVEYMRNYNAKQELAKLSQNPDVPFGSQFGSEVLTFFNDPKSITEELALFGTFTLANKAVRFAKYGKEILFRPVAVTTSAHSSGAGVVLTGRPALRALVAGQANKPGFFTRLGTRLGSNTDAAIRAGRRAASGEVAGRATFFNRALPTSVLLTLSETTRSYINQKNFELHGDKVLAAEHIALIAGGGLFAGQLSAWQVNAGLTARNMHKATNQVNALVENKIRDYARSTRRAPTDLMPEEFTMIRRRILNDMSNTDFATVPHKTQVGMVDRHLHFFMRSPETLSKVVDNTNYQRAIGDLSDNMSLPDYMRVGSDVSSDAFAFAQSNNSTKLAIMKGISKTKGPRIDRNWDANLDSWNRLIGRLVLEETSDRVGFFRSEARRLNWEATEAQENLAIGMANALDQRLNEVNRLASDAGGFNINFVDFNDRHFSRLWNSEVLLQRREEFVELFAEYLTRQGLTDSELENIRSLLGPDELITLVRQGLPEGADEAAREALSKAQSAFTQAHEDAMEIIAGFTAYNTSAATAWGSRGVSQHRLRNLNIDTNFSMISPTTGRQISVLDGVDTHAGNILDNLTEKIGPQLYTALKNHDPVVRDLLRSSSEAFKEGRYAKAENLRVAAEISEILSNTGMSDSVIKLQQDLARIEDLASQLSQSNEGRRLFESLTDSQGNTIIPARGTRAHQDAVLQTYDFSNDTNLVTQVADLRRKVARLKEDSEIAKYNKDYSEFEALPNYSPTRKKLWDFVESGALEEDSARLFLQNADVSGLRFRQDEYLQSRRSIGNRRYGPLWVNAKGMLKERLRRIGVAPSRGLGRATWGKRELVAAKEAAELLYFHLPASEINKFKSLFRYDNFEIDTLGIKLEAISLGQSVPLRAKGFHEVFTEALVRKIAGSDSLSYLDDIVPDTEAFRQFVEKHSRGFYRKKTSKEFLSGSKAQGLPDRAVRFDTEIAQEVEKIEAIIKRAEDYVSGAGVEAEAMVRDLLRRLPMEGPVSPGGLGVRQRRSGPTTSTGEENIGTGVVGRIRPDDPLMASENAATRGAVRESMVGEQSAIAREFDETLARIENLRSEANKFIREHRLDTAGIGLHDHVTKRMRYEEELNPFLNPMDAVAARNLDQQAVKGEIVKSGIRQYERAQRGQWNIYRMIREGQRKNSNRQEIHELVEAYNKTLDRMQGTGLLNPEGMTVRNVGKFITKVLYANAATTLAVTQLHDHIAPIFVAGLGGWMRYMTKVIPLYAPGFMTAKTVSAQKRFEAGTMTMADYALLAETSHKVSALYPDLGSHYGDASKVTGRYLGLTSPDTARHYADTGFSRSMRFVADKVEQVSDVMIGHTMHEIVKRTRIAGYMYATEVLPSVIKKAIAGDENAISLATSLGIGDKFLLERLGKELEEHSGDFTKFSPQARLTVRSAIQRYTNNLVMAPTTTATPATFDTPIGRILLSFKRFLVNAPQKHLPNAYKRGGTPAVVGALMGTTMWGMMVEGYIKPYIKGQPTWDGFDKKPEDWTVKDWATIGRIINSSGQFGYLPEMLITMGAYDQSRVPSFYNIQRAFNKLRTGIPEQVDLIKDNFAANGSRNESTKSDNMFQPISDKFIEGLSMSVGLTGVTDVLRWYRGHQELEQERKWEEFMAPSQRELQNKSERQKKINDF